MDMTEEAQAIDGLTDVFDLIVKRWADEQHTERPTICMVLAVSLGRRLGLEVPREHMPGTLEILSRVLGNTAARYAATLEAEECETPRR